MRDAWDPFLPGILGLTKDDDDTLSGSWGGQERVKGKWKSRSFWGHCRVLEEMGSACKNADTWAIPEQLSQSFWRWDLGISLSGDSAAQGA